MQPALLPAFASLTRRDFLKITAAELLALFLPSVTVQAALPGQQGRVLETRVAGYQKPSLQSKEVKEYWKDMVLPITEATIGDEEPAFNRVWYRIGEESFVHSGGIQPIQVQLNQPNPSLPAGGALAEVTVPYTDAHRGAGKNFPVAYRLYYETTHWVTHLISGAEGELWYQIAEDKWKDRYYAPAEHLRLVPDEELAPLAPDVPPDARRIEVRTGPQVVIAYEWDRPVFVTRTATGAHFSNGDFSTPPGHYITNHKRPSRHMAAGNLAFNGYDLPGVPWICYFTERGLSFHGTYWHNNFGRPRSHGCVNLTPRAAKWIYRWTTPVVPPGEQDIYENYGTSVDVIT